MYFQMYGMSTSEDGASISNKFIATFSTSEMEMGGNNYGFYHWISKYSKTT
jgi:hypothetical protein